jgi:hypothetical protein
MSLVCIRRIRQSGKYKKQWSEKDKRYHWQLEDIYDDEQSGKKIIDRSSKSVSN